MAEEKVFNLAPNSKIEQQSTTQLVWPQSVTIVHEITWVMIFKILATATVFVYAGGAVALVLYFFLSAIVAFCKAMGFIQ